MNEMNEQHTYILYVYMLFCIQRQETKKNIYNGSTSQYLNLFPPIAADIFDNLWFIFDQMKWIITIAFVFPGTYYYIDFYFTISIKTKQLRFSTIT